MFPGPHLLVEPADHLLVALQLRLAVLQLGLELGVLTPQAAHLDELKLEGMCMSGERARPCADAQEKHESSTMT